MQSIDKPTFDNYSAKIYFRYGEDPCVISASDNALAVLGVTPPASEEEKEASLQLLEYATMHSLESIALTCEKEMLPDEIEHHTMLQGVYLHRMDGVYSEVSCWVLCRRTDGERECIIDFIEDTGRNDEQRAEMMDQFVAFASRAFDFVFTINYEKRSVTCWQALSFKTISVPVGIPMYPPDSFALWIKAVLDEKDWDRANAFLDLMNRPQLGKTRRDVFMVHCDGVPVPFEVMIVGCNCGSVVMMHHTSEQQALETSQDQPLEHPEVFIRTFGHFDVFVNGQAIPFASEKAKEYLALLVDRRGGCVSSREAAVNLYERADKASYAKCRKAALYMNKALQQYGIEDIIESVGSSRKLVLGKVRCDLFEYFAADPEQRQLMYNGSYLNDYSWGEITKAELTYY